LWNGWAADPDPPEIELRKLTMTKTTQTVPVESGSTDITRFNALRHGVLSRYTVLPWESADEYRAVVEALVAEHGPQGPTEEHLVEEIAGILWRKRRLRLAEAAAHRRGLEGTLASYRETVKVALVHLDTTGQSERVVDAIRATATDTDEDIADMETDEAMTRRALDLLGSKRDDAYEAALAALREDTQGGHTGRRSRRTWRRRRASHRRCRKPAPLPRRRDAAVVRKPEERIGQSTADPRAGVRRGARRRQTGAARPLRGPPRCKLERMLAMLLRLKDLRQGIGPT